MSTVTDPFPNDIEKAVTLLELSGYVVILATSYRGAQSRQRVAQARMNDAMERERSVEAWAQANCVEERRLRERLTFVYGVARAHGATDAELVGPPEVTEIEKEESGAAHGDAATLPETLRTAAEESAARPEWTKRRMPTIHPKT